MARENEVITFKADKELLEAMRGVTNRSAFIRQAILAALENICPVCGGEGVLTPSQQSHWMEFAEHHHMEKCENCREMRVVCDADQELSV